MTRLHAVALAVLLGVGCESSPEAELEAFCAHVCDCQTGLPSLKRQCVEACVADLATSDPPPGCLQCLGQLTCAELECGEECVPACSGPDF